MFSNVSVYGKVSGETLSAFTHMQPKFAVNILRKMLSCIHKYIRKHVCFIRIVLLVFSMVLFNES